MKQGVSKRPNPGGLYLFVLFVAALGLYCTRASSACSERGLLSATVLGFSARRLLSLPSMGFRYAGFVVVAHGA